MGGVWRLCIEFLSFLRQEKKWWLIPLILLLVGVAGAVLFGSGPVTALLAYPIW